MIEFQNVFEYESHGPEDTAALGERLGREAAPGEVYTLIGDLGVGKTVFTQGVARGLGIKDCVNSPTFTIVQSYEDGRLPFYHFDVYRIGDVEEMEEIIYLAEFHAARGHMEQMAELDNRFHTIMYEACASKMLEHLLKDYHQYVWRVRQKTLSSNRGAVSNVEHKFIMEAIKENNPDKAEELANQHMLNAYENMVEKGLLDLYE